MIAKINKGVEEFQEFFDTNFPRCDQESMEILLMLACGHIFDIFTPNQLIQILGLNKNDVYNAINSWSIHHVRKLCLNAGFSQIKELIAEVLAKSPATRSRMRITLSVDDTVIDRMGNLMSLTYSWFSGRHHDVVKGQNIIAITMKIGERVIPLCVRPVGKQGRGNTSKPEIFKEMVRKLAEVFGQEGIDLTDFPITFDSWYGSYDLVKILKQAGFDKQEGFDQILILLANHAAFGSIALNRDVRVLARGVPVSQSSIRAMLIAAAVSIFCRCVFVRPIYRACRNPNPRTP